MKLSCAGLVPSTASKNTPSRWRVSCSETIDGSTRCSSERALESAPNPVAAAVQGNRKRAPGNLRCGEEDLRRKRAEAPLARAQPRVRFGMADGEQLEFEREQREAAILRDLCVVLAQRAQEFRWSFRAGRAARSLRRCAGQPIVRAARRKCLPCFRSWRKRRRACSRRAQRYLPAARPQIRRAQRFFPRRAEASVGSPRCAPAGERWCRARAGSRFSPRSIRA